VVAGALCKEIGLNGKVHLRNAQAHPMRLGVFMVPPENARRARSEASLI
jgi:hypothetical protein